MVGRELIPIRPGYRAWIGFFFQAEDGIRDVAVTGVQTCALPIYTTQSIAQDVPVRSERAARKGGRAQDQTVQVVASDCLPGGSTARRLVVNPRSRER